MIRGYRAVDVIRIREFLGCVFRSYLLSLIASFLFIRPRCVCSSCPVSSPLFVFTGIVSVARVLCVVIVCVVWLFRSWSRRFSVLALSRLFLRFVVLWFAFVVSLSFLLFGSFVFGFAVSRVSLPLRYGSFRSIFVRLSSLRVSVYVWNVPLSLYRFVVVGIVSSWSGSVRSVCVVRRVLDTLRLCFVFRCRFRIVVLSVLHCRAL